MKSPETVDATGKKPVASTVLILCQVLIKKMRARNHCVAMVSVYLQCHRPGSIQTTDSNLLRLGRIFQTWSAKQIGFSQILQPKPFKSQLLYAGCLPTDNGFGPELRYIHPKYH